MSEKIFKALDEAVRSAAGIAQIASEVRRLAEARVSQRRAQGAHSTFENVENSVETHTGSRQPAQGEVVELFDSAVAAELPRVSHAEYDSHEVCKQFASRLRERIAKLATPPAPSVPDAWREVAEHLRYCRDCAESDISKCFDGAELWNRAASPEVPRV